MILSDNKYKYLRYIDSNVSSFRFFLGFSSHFLFIFIFTFYIIWSKKKIINQLAEHFKFKPIWLLILIRRFSDHNLIACYDGFWYAFSSFQVDLNDTSFRSIEIETILVLFYKDSYMRTLFLRIVFKNQGEIVSQMHNYILERNERIWFEQLQNELLK